MNLEFYFTKLDPQTAANIQQAIEKGEMFGLAGKRSISIFAPKQLRSIQIFGHRSTQQAFASIYEMYNGISLTLLGSKTFIPLSRLLPYCNEKALPLPKTLGVE